MKTNTIKYKGKRLYEYARKGIVIDDIPSRDITVYSIERTSDIEYKDDCAFFDYQVHASKGLYVRTLSYDIGKKCGFPAHNFDLKRVKAGKFDISESYTLEEIEKGEYAIIPMSDALSHLPKIEIKDHLRHHVKNGMAISIKEFPSTTLTRIVDVDGTLLAIYDKHKTENKMKAQNVFSKD